MRQTLIKPQFIEYYLTTFCSYFRQIRYGCQNPDCETTTCLSCQKRRAKGPFRRLTVLSARTLASLLASQDHPERDLCPHLPSLVKQPDETLAVKRKGKKSSQIHTKTFTQAPPSPENAEAHSARIRTPERQDSGQVWAKINKNTSYTEHQETLPLSKGDLAASENNRVKDVKSFTQNLYDTFSWRALQSLIYQSGSFAWVSPSSADGTVKPNAETMNAAHSKLDPYASSGNHTTSSPNIEEENNTGTKEDEAPLGKTSYAATINHEGPKAVEFSKVLDPTINILSGKSNQKVDCMKGSGKPSKNGCEFPSDQLHGQENRSPLKDINANLFNPFATLSHFTLENVKALARSTKPSRLSEQCLGLSMGRTEASVKSADISTWSQFAIQSIVYILGTTVPLLQSFKQVDETLTQDSSNHAHQSNHPNDIVCAFRQLRQLEGHPQRIFPSLWISLEDAFAWDARARLSIPRDRYIPKALPSGRYLNATGYRTYNTDGKMMPNLDAAHIIKVALSALVASVPDCAPETWENVIKLRASGRIAPDLESSELRIRFRSLATTWEVMDAYEDELAISLMTRLIRAFTTRRCWSEILDAVVSDGMGDSVVKEKSAEFTESLLQFLQEEKGETSSFKKDKPISRDDRGPVLSLNDDDSSVTQDSNVPSFSMITLEWLRNIMLKEWDGKPEISRWSTVGGTLDFMACLCSSCQGKTAVLALLIP